MADDKEWLKLPTDEQCTHKVWKSRLHGYEEATKLFNKISDEKSPEYSKYAGLLKKFVIDSNAVAQEKGLDAVLAYQANAALAPRTCGEVVAGVVAKCLNSSRTKTKQKGIEILMVYIELEKQDVVMEEVLKGLTNKQPKIVTACLLVIREAVRDFGNKIIALKPVVKSLQKVLEHSDKNVREEAKLLTIEMYRWIGAAIKPSLQNIKPVQLKELEEEFGKLPGKTPKQQRFLKSQQDLKAKAEAQDEEGGEDEDDDDEADAGPAIDPFDLMEAQEILSKLPKDFYDSVEAKKWQTRKEALEAVLPLATRPKLEAGDYADLIRALKKVLAKDTNVMIVAVAGKCLCGLAKGLRKKFAPYAVQCTAAILEKFKEKKITVVTVLREAIDAMFPSTTLQNIMEDVIAALDNKNPSIRAETAGFLARAFAQCTLSTLPKSVLKPLCGSLVQKLGDTTPAVRDSAAEALGTALKVVGERPMTPFFADLDKIKMDKIKECSEKVELAKGGGGKKAAAASAPAKEKPQEKSKASAGPPKKAAAKKPAKSAAKSAPGGGKSASKSIKGGKKKAGGSGGDAPSEPNLTDEEVEERAKAMLSANILTQLASANWKERLAGMEECTTKVHNMEKKDVDAQVIVRILGKKPGWKEANFQVMGAKVQLVGIIAEKARFTKTSASYCIQGMIDKIGDIKSGSKVQETMTAMAEATTLGFISLEGVKYAIDGQKNPKNQAEMLNWLAQAIQEFGFSTLQPKAYISYSKKALAAINPQVRAAGINLLGVMYMYMGGTLRMLFEDEKPALLQQIDAEFEKVSGQTPPAPFRGVSKKRSGDDNDDEEDEGDEEGDGDQAGPGMNIVDLIERTDISAQITPGLIAEINDTKWKLRGEALEKVEGILKQAKFITPNLGDLPAALKTRLGDSNKNIARQAASICGTIATAMGPAVKKYASTLIPGILVMTSDSKPQVRASGVETMKLWEEQIGLAPFIDDEVLSTALALNKPFIKIEVFGFLATSLPKYRTLPGDLALSVPHLFSSLEDRNADVRKKATEALPGFMMHLSYEKTVKMTGKLKQSSKTQVCSILEKERENIPTKPGKPASSSKPSKKGAASSSSASSPDEVLEKPTKAPSKRPKTAPAKSESNSNSASSSEPPPPDNESAAGNGGKKPKEKAASGIAKGKVGSKSSRKKKDEDEDFGPALIMTKGKDRRIRDEHDLKVLKWNFTAPRQEYVDQLKEQMENCVSKTMLTKLFHNDFKQQLIAISMLNESLDSCKDATVGALDLILKWMTLRFFDTNTSLHIKGLEYLNGLFAMLAEDDYNLLDHEAHSFIPYLIIKVGDSKENIRKLTRSVLRLLTKVYPASKMFTFIMEGIKSKNSRQRTECLEELGGLVETYGLNICQPSPPKAVKEIAGQIGDRDNSVRSAALNTLVLIYLHVGEDIYKYVGKLNDKDMEMLKERIKRSARKNPPAAKSAPQQNQQKADDKTANKPGKSALPPGWRDAYRWMKKKMKGDQVKSAAPGGPDPIDDDDDYDYDVDEERNPSKGPRPATAPPAANKDMNANRPKVFSLDLDKLGLDTTADDKLSDLKLEDTNCVDELLTKPVVLPPRRVQKPSTPNNMQLNLLISQIASNDLAVCIQALAQLDEVLKLQDKEKVMAEHVDQLLVTTSLQLRMAFSKHMGDENTSKDVVRMYRCLVALLMTIFRPSKSSKEMSPDESEQLFQCHELAQKASKDVLCDLINGLITALIDDRLMSFDEGPQVVRSVNVLMVKVVENADPNNALGSLIKLLHECVQHESNSPKFIQLVMKCLWRMVRMMPNIINQLKVEHVLLDIHLFLRAFPSSSWKERSSDVPLRTVKTILHSLAKILGNKVLNYFTLISNPKESEVESYLKKVLRSSSRSSTGSLEQVNGTASDIERNNNPHQQSHTRSTPRRAARNQDLTIIFGKIGSKENTREGLAELYDFKLRYPEEDIEPFLKKTSQVFQNYIERGLRNIAAERGDKGTISMSSVTKSQPISTTASAPILNSKMSTSTDNENISPSALRERLKALRTQCGIDNTEGSNNNPKPTQQSNNEQQPPKEPLSSSDRSSIPGLYQPERISLGSSSSNVQAPQQQNSSADNNVDDLKKRLDRIKSSLK